MIALAALSFIAGVLTVAAPCVLPLLPVILGGSIVDAKHAESNERKWLRPLVVAASLAVSVVIFTLLLKATTSLLGVPETAWRILSGSIVIVLGVQYLWPRLWEKVSVSLNLTGRSYRALGGAEKRRGLSGEIMTGAALGPVFSSCSPTYAFIVAAVLPTAFITGLLYLVAYAMGMSVTLLLVAYLGRSFADKLGWLSDPRGLFRKVIGALFVIIGIGVIFGFDKDIQAYVLAQGWYDPISNLENSFHN